MLSKMSSNKLKKSIPLIILFVLSTFFFLYQHSSNLSWDFSSYVLNAKYLFYEGTYFESSRQPLPPLLLGIFLIFETFGEYLYILFVSALFLFANISLADASFKESALNRKLNKNYIRFAFYFFSISGFTLMYGMSAGSEMLALAFLELFLAALIQGKISGHYIALAFLSRYTMVIFAPLVIFNRNYKKILVNILLFLAIVFPWLLFNYLKHGNWFASIVDAFAQNIYLRSYLIQPFDPAVLLRVIGWFIPFLILGVIAAIIIFVKEKNKLSKTNLINFLFAVLFVMVVLDFMGIPLKVERYLFNLTIPIAFFSTLGLIFLISRFKKLKKISIPIILVIFIMTSVTATYFFHKNATFDDRFHHAAEDIKLLGLEQCQTLSPYWVLLSYLDINSHPLGDTSIPISIHQNKTVLIFPDLHTIDDIFDPDVLNQYPTLKKTDEYILLGKPGLTPESCSKQHVSDKPYIKNHCEVLSTRFEKLNLDSIALKVCEKINKKS